MAARAHVRVRGRVQGVCFRTEARAQARSLGLDGWVRDNPDGTVEAAFAGEESRVDLAVSWCRHGPSARAGRQDRRRLGGAAGAVGFSVLSVDRMLTRPAELGTALARSRAGLALRRLHNWVQLAKFCAVGASGYVVNLGVYALLLGAGVDYRAAAVCSFLVAVTNNYTWNRLWTFRGQRGHFAYQGMRFLVVSRGRAAANLVFLSILVGLGVGKIVAQAIAIVLVTPAELRRQQALELRLRSRAGALFAKRDRARCVLRRRPGRGRSPRRARSPLTRGRRGRRSTAFLADARSPTGSRATRRDRVRRRRTRRPRGSGRSTSGRGDAGRDRARQGRRQAAS